MYNLLHLQSAKKSFILSDCGSLHAQKMKLVVNDNDLLTGLLGQY